LSQDPLFVCYQFLHHSRETFSIFFVNPKKLSISEYYLQSLSRNEATNITLFEQRPMAVMADNSGYFGAGQGVMDCLCDL